MDHPAFAVDSRGAFVAWNPAASSVLGYPLTAIKGRRCWQLLAGRDRYGNCYCGPSCPLREMARQGEPVRATRLHFRAADGRSIDFGVVTVPTPASPRAEPDIVHVLSADPRADSAPAPTQETSASGGETSLTRLEMQILRQLDQGHSAQEIAETLQISLFSTRQHIRTVLRKLAGFHNRLAAVRRAYRLGLL